MLSKGVFCVLSGVKITLRNPKISWKIFTLKAFVPSNFWAKLSQIASKKQREFDPWILEKNHK